MLDEKMLNQIIATFAEHNIPIVIQAGVLTSVNGQETTIKVADYMPNQLIELICKIFENQVIKKAWGLLP